MGKGSELECDSIRDRPNRCRNKTKTALTAEVHVSWTASACAAIAHIGAGHSAIFCCCVITTGLGSPAIYIVISRARGNGKA